MASDCGVEGSKTRPKQNSLPELTYLEFVPCFVGSGEETFSFLYVVPLYMVDKET